MGSAHNRTGIPNRVDIDERPTVANNRERVGDWEADTIIGKNHKGAIVTLDDCTSKLRLAYPLEGKKAHCVVEAMVLLLNPIKKFVKTITFDKLISNHQIDPVDIGLIKIDIEGGEKYIFDNNFKNFLTIYKPNLLISLHYVFLHFLDCHTIIAFLDTIYNCYNIKGELLNINHEITHQINHTEMYCTKK
jgi:hypothetical protein